MIAYTIHTPDGPLVNMALMDMKYAIEGTHYPEPWVVETDTSDLARTFSGWDRKVHDLVAVGFFYTPPP
jgi:hypothetical protein